MSLISNSPDAFGAIRLAQQAREVLQRLADCNGQGNDQLFYRWLSEIGLGLPMRSLQELLDRLERDGLLSTEPIGNLRVLRLTLRGEEVARGLAAIEWIGRPEHGVSTTQES